MKLKPLALTVAVLAVLSAIVFVLNRPPAPAAQDPRAGQPVLAAAAVEKAAQVRITDQGKTVTLARQADGKWLVSSYYDLPADLSKLARLIDDLAGAKVQRLVARTPERLARLELKGTAIAFLDSASNPLWKLSLGKDAEAGGRFAKFDDETKGYLTNLATYLDAESRNWADSLLLDIKANDIASVELGFPKGDPVVATREKAEAAWTAQKAPAGQRLKDDRIVSLLSSLTSLRFQESADLADAGAEAARKNFRTIKLTTFDHKTFTIHLGRKPEEKIVKPAAEPKPNTVPKPAAAAEPAKPDEPKADTIPAGPVYAFIAASDPAAPVNALMKKRAFQTFEWAFTGLPEKADELFEPIPAPAKPSAEPPEGKAAGKQAPAPAKG